MKANSVFSRHLRAVTLGILSASAAFGQYAPYPPYVPIGSVLTNATFLPDFSEVPYPNSVPPVVASPAPATNFLGLTATGITSPPDTEGAVGPNHIVTMLNTQVQFQNRAGTVLSTMTLSNFWYPNVPQFSPGTSLAVFDPHILYDPFSQRWIASSGLGAGSTNSRILIGVSLTSDPSGTWYLSSVPADTALQRWADFPTLGFNKNWIVVSANLFSIYGTNGFDRSRFYVFNKTNAYAGFFTNVTLLDDTGQAGYEYPATTYDDSISTLYIMQNAGGFGRTNGTTNGYLRLRTITGAIGSPVLNYTVSNAFYFKTTATWNDQEPNSGADFAPQFGLTNKIQNNQSYVQDLVYRNGYLWLAQTVYLPAGTPTHSAVQWWQLAVTTNNAGGIIQFGRIEDTTGSNYFAFPSIAVNRFNDVLIGHSRYCSNQYVSADYAFRGYSDQLNIMHSDFAFKNGEDSYLNISAEGNRWGDYSAACVDPTNDADFWTVQEYSRPHVGTLTVNGSGRWGTWWANVTVAVPANDNFNAAFAISGSQGATNGNNIRGTKETGEPNHAGNVGGASVWYKWTAPTNGSVTMETVNNDFPTLLAVYTGTAVSSLTSVASNNGSAGDGASQVIFTALAGTNYEIAVDGNKAAIGYFTLTWLQPAAPVFTLVPEDQSIYQGANATFTANAIGTPNPTYQWKLDGTNIVGATNAGYSITNVQPTNAGYYSVTASNSAGSTNSAGAALIVLTSEATLDGLSLASNAFTFTVAQVVGLSYVIEMSTNVATNWVSISTNVAPFTVTNTVSSNDVQRYYKGVYQP
jgi:hypothetical protein